MGSFSRSFYLLVGLAALTMSAGPSLADSAASSVSVDTNRRTYILGDLVQISLENNSGEKIFIPGCQSFQVERFGSERYEPLPGAPCIAEGEARMLEAGTTDFSFQPKKAHLDSPLRISMVYGVGCSEQRPLSQARCRDFGTVYTHSFRVRERIETEK
jgi:hypothetical protein